jgi:hypothetical protein
MADMRADLVDFTTRGLRKVSRVSAARLAQAQQRARAYEVRLTQRIDGPVRAADYLAREVPRLRPLELRPSTSREPAVRVLGFLGGGVFGGMATALMLGAALAQELDRPLDVIQTHAFDGTVDFGVHVRNAGFAIPADRCSTVDVSRRHTPEESFVDVHPDDVFVVSAWWDAHHLQQSPLVDRFIYLVQDYEPIFYPNSDEHALAHATYLDDKAVRVYNSSVLSEFFVAEGVDTAETALWFEPAVDVVTEVSEAPSGGLRTLFLYGRPQVPRNLFGLSIAALDQALHGPVFEGWRVVTAGSNDIPDITFTSGHRLELLQTMPRDEYFAFAASVDLALTPMLAPHPNYPTLEIGSLGRPVVSTTWRTKTDLSRYSPSIRLAEPDVDSLAAALVSAAGQAPVGPGSFATALSPSWTGALKPVARDALRKMGR